MKIFQNFVRYLEDKSGLGLTTAERVEILDRLTQLQDRHITHATRLLITSQKLASDENNLLDCFREAQVKGLSPQLFKRMEEIMRVRVGLAQENLEAIEDVVEDTKSLIHQATEIVNRL